jgi:hypothetical protein
MVANNDESSPRKVGSDSAARDLVQAAATMVNTGALPREDTARILAGPGEGRRCALCAESIGTTEVEYEMGATDARTYRFHIPCYLAWKQAVGLADSSGGRHG